MITDIQSTSRYCTRIYIIHLVHLFLYKNNVAALAMLFPLLQKRMLSKLTIFLVNKDNTKQSSAVKKTHFFTFLLI